MRTIEQKIYKFSELSEDVQNKVLEKMMYYFVEDIWWENTYEDAENIGLKITSFDLDRNRHAKGEFLLNAIEVAQNILNNHGKNCETYKTADKFLKAHELIFSEYLDDSSVYYESSEKEDKLMGLEEDFLRDILEDYSIMLQNEMEDLTSDEYLTDFLNDPENEYFEDGSIFHN